MSGDHPWLKRLFGWSLSTYGHFRRSGSGGAGLRRVVAHRVPALALRRLARCGSERLRGPGRSVCGERQEKFAVDQDLEVPHRGQGEVPVVVQDAHHGAGRRADDVVVDAPRSSGGGPGTSGPDHTKSGPEWLEAACSRLRPQAAAAFLSIPSSRQKPSRLSTRSSWLLLPWSVARTAVAEASMPRIRIPERRRACCGRAQEA